MPYIFAMLVCLELINYSDPFDFVQINFGPTPGNYSTRRDLVPTPQGRFCTDIDTTATPYAAVSTCRKQPGTEVSVCSAPSPEVHLVFPPASTSYRAAQAQ